MEVLGSSVYLDYFCGYALVMFDEMGRRTPYEYCVIDAKHGMTVEPFGAIPHDKAMREWERFCHDQFEKRFSMSKVGVEFSFIIHGTLRYKFESESKLYYPFDWKIIDGDYLSWELADDTDRHFFVPNCISEREVCAAIVDIRNNYGHEYLTIPPQGGYL